MLNAIEVSPHLGRKRRSISRSTIQKPRGRMPRSTPTKPSRRVDLPSPNRTVPEEPSWVGPPGEDEAEAIVVNAQRNTERPQQYEAFMIGNVSLLNPPSWDPNEQMEVSAPSPNIGLRTPVSPRTSYQTNCIRRSESASYETQFNNLPYQQQQQLRSPPVSYLDSASTRYDEKLQIQVQPQQKPSEPSRNEDVIFRPPISTFQHHGVAGHLISSRQVTVCSCHKPMTLEM
jgi:hypothetical protein